MRWIFRLLVVLMAEFRLTVAGEVGHGSEACQHILTIPSTA
jgi:hypothetical protein